MWPFKPKDTVESLTEEYGKATSAVLEVLREFEYCVSPQDRYTVLVHHIGYLNSRHNDDKWSLGMLKDILNDYVVPGNLH